MKINNELYIYIYINKNIIFFLLIIINISLNENAEINCTKKKSYISPIIHNYKLYNTRENFFFSLIFDFSNSNLFNNDYLLNILKDLSTQTFKNFQIIVSLNSSFIKNHNIVSFLKEKEILIHVSKSKKWSNNFFDLINKIQGKFIILINKKIKLKENDLQNIFNKTKGSIKNIIKFEIENIHSFYLIRTKILRDIIDREVMAFLNFNSIINYINKKLIPKINYIPIAYCPNNYYTSLAYTSMISILISKYHYTYVSFYLVIPINFAKKNIRLIESLYEQFEYFNITFINMDNRYEKAYTNRYLSKNAFFRLSLGELLPNLNKVIYLDSDTICLKDLSNLFNINFKGKIFLARIATFKPGYLNFTVNTGVLLLNLIGMRRIKFEKKVLSLLNNGFRDPIYHDQAIINRFYKKYIGFLPVQYNSLGYNFAQLKYFKKKISKLYDFDSLYFSTKFPSILHFAGNPKYKTYNNEDWYYFARKSKYFEKRSFNYSIIFNYNLARK